MIGKILSLMLILALLLFVFAEFAFLRVFLAGMSYMNQAEPTGYFSYASYYQSLCSSTELDDGCEFLKSKNCEAGEDISNCLMRTSAQDWKYTP